MHLYKSVSSLYQWLHWVTTTAYSWMGINRWKCELTQNDDLVSVCSSFALCWEVNRVLGVYIAHWNYWWVSLAWKKNSVVTGETNPGTLAFATSALATELRQPTTSKTFTFYLWQRLALNSHTHTIFVACDFYVIMHHDTGHKQSFLYYGFAHVQGVSLLSLVLLKPSKSRWSF